MKISGMESYADVETSGSGLSYTWTISNLPIGTEVTFTESGYALDGYNLISTVTDSAHSNAPGASGTATPSADTPLPASAKVAFINAYEAGVELPSTGGPGTVPYTAFGLALLLGAGLWLFLRRKKQTA